MNVSREKFRPFAAGALLGINALAVGFMIANHQDEGVLTVPEGDRVVNVTNTYITETRTYQQPGVDENNDGATDVQKQEVDFAPEAYAGLGLLALDAMMLPAVTGVTIRLGKGN